MSQTLSTEGPERFYDKTLHPNNNFSYELRPNNILEYIAKHVKHEEFVVITFLGKSQVGKSHLIQNLTGIKHNVGEYISPETAGASIAYGGTIEEVYKRMGIEETLDIPYKDREVFFCDTEGVYNESSKGSIAALIMPLIILSSKIVAVLPPRPDSAITTFLSICKSFLKVTDDNIVDPFENKLIVRCVDYPFAVMNPKTDVEKYTNKMQNESQMICDFKDQSIYPICVPGGPWDPQKQCHLKEFTKNLLDKMFDNQDNMIVYSNPQKFVNDVETVNKSPISDCANIMTMFKEKNLAEKLLDYVTIQIEDKINNFFCRFVDNMEIDEQECEKFFEETVRKPLINISEKNKIKKKYLDHYLDLEIKFFNQKKRQLLIRISKFRRYSRQIESAKSLKQKLCDGLQLISDNVKDHSQNAADYIFYNVDNHFTKIEKYEHTIINYINKQREICMKDLGDLHFSDEDIVSEIQSDIAKVFDKLLEFKSFTFYREHGVISKILKFFFDKVEEKAEADEIAPNVWGIINKKKNKYCRIHIESRNYFQKFDRVLNSIVEKEILSNLKENQKEQLQNYIEENNIESIADLTDDQIRSITLNHVLQLNDNQLEETP